MTMLILLIISLMFIGSCGSNNIEYNHEYDGKTNTITETLPYGNSTDQSLILHEIKSKPISNERLKNVNDFEQLYLKYCDGLTDE